MKLGVVPSSIDELITHIETLTKEMSKIHDAHIEAINVFTRMHSVNSLKSMLLKCDSVEQTPENQAILHVISQYEKKLKSLTGSIQYLKLFKIERYDLEVLKYLISDDSTRNFIKLIGVTQFEVAHQIREIKITPSSNPQLIIVNEQLQDMHSFLDQHRFLETAQPHPRNLLTRLIEMDLEFEFFQKYTDENRDSMLFQLNELFSRLPFEVKTSNSSPQESDSVEPAEEPWGESFPKNWRLPQRSSWASWNSSASSAKLDSKDVRPGSRSSLGSLPNSIQNASKTLSTHPGVRTTIADSLADDPRLTDMITEFDRGLQLSDSQAATSKASEPLTSLSASTTVADSKSPIARPAPPTRIPRPQSQMIKKSPLEGENSGGDPKPMNRRMVGVNPSTLSRLPGVPVKAAKPSVNKSPAVPTTPQENSSAAITVAPPNKPAPRPEKPSLPSPPAVTETRTVRSTSLPTPALGRNSKPDSSRAPILNKFGYGRSSSLSPTEAKPNPILPKPPEAKPTPPTQAIEAKPTAKPLPKKSMGPKVI